MMSATLKLFQPDVTPSLHPSLGSIDSIHARAHWQDYLAITLKIHKLHIYITRSITLSQVNTVYIAHQTSHMIMICTVVPNVMS